MTLQKLLRYCDLIKKILAGSIVQQETMIYFRLFDRNAQQLPIAISSLLS